MSQVVYTELEGFPVCWPYKQTRPFSSSQKLNAQNITGSASTTEENIGLIEGADRYDYNIYGSNEIQKFIRASKNYRVSKVVVRVKKAGTPPDNLYVRVQDGGWLLQGYGVTAAGTAVTQLIYGSRRVAIRFQARFSGSRIAVSGLIYVNGSPPPLVIELRDSTDGSIMGSTLLASTTLTFGSTGWQKFVASLTSQTQEGRYYSIIFYIQNNGGDGSNWYAFVYNTSQNQNLLNITAHYSTDGGSSWEAGYLAFLAVAIWRDVSRYVEASVAASSVGTSYSDLTITLPSAFYALDAPPFIVIRIYSPNCNSSNYYAIAVRDYTTAAPDELAFQANGLVEFHSYTYYAWRCVAARGAGLEMIKIYEQDITLVKRIPAASPQPKIDITFSGATILGIFSYGNSKDYVERSSSGAFLNKVLSPGTLRMELYVCNGSTTITDITYTEQVYFDKNPVTPRDFGFSELYLLRVDLPAGGQIRMNDHAAGDLYSSSATTITFADFRIPVRKIEVISGAPTLWFIGVI
ncbi:MAG: hypothetical protein QXS76_00835 [Candidatus Bathyarchaeia archaeon]